MRGTILDYSIQTSVGLIIGEDGKRYSFPVREWKEQGPPVRGIAVDFDPKEDNATAVYIVSGTASMPHGPPPILALPAQQKPKLSERTWFHVFWLFFFFPVGLVLLWRTKRYPKLVRFGPAAFVVFALFFGMIAGQKHRAELNAREYRYTVTTTEPLPAIDNALMLSTLWNTAVRKAAADALHDPVVDAYTDTARKMYNAGSTEGAMAMAGTIAKYVSQNSIRNAHRLFLESAITIPAGEDLDIVHLYAVLEDNHRVVTTHDESTASYALVIDSATGKTLGVVEFQSISSLERKRNEQVQKDEVSRPAAEEQKQEDEVLKHVDERQGQKEETSRLAAEEQKQKDDTFQQQQEEVQRKKDEERRVLLEQYAKSGWGQNDAEAQPNGEEQTRKAAEVQKQKDDALRQKAAEEQRKKDEEARIAAEERAKAERLGPAVSRLFVSNWKAVAGKINPSSKLTVVANVEPSRVDPHQRYDLDQGSIFIVTFSRAEDEAPKTEPSAAQGFGDFSSLAKVRVKTRGSANSAGGDESLVRNLKLRGWGVDNLKNLLGLLEKFESWSKTASDNKVADVDKALGDLENPGTGPLQLTFSVDRSGVASLRWEIGAVSFSQQGAEVKATERVIKSALDQAASLKDESLKRASSGEDIKSKEDLFK